MQDYLVRQNDVHNGIQKIYFFPNGYGASVVQHDFSYGNESGLWEAGVIVFDEEGDYYLTYETSVTDDVIGFLTWEEVEEILLEIQRLEPEDEE
jgi:hypothetical protein